MHIWVSDARDIAEPPEEPVVEPHSSVPATVPEDPVRLLNAIIKNPC